MTSKFQFFLITLLFFLFFTSDVFPTDFISSLPFFSKDSLKTRMAYLSSDALEGRATGSQGEKVAATYIAGHLKKCDITPLGANGTYFQKIPMHASKPTPASKLTLYSSTETTKFLLGKDYLLYKSGAQTFIPNPVEIVFVGYGIVAPEYDYNDYHSIDVSGKVVAFLSGEPESDDPAFFHGSDYTIYSLPESKERTAISRGALGSIMIFNSRDAQSVQWKKWQRDFSFENVSLAYDVTSHLFLVMNSLAARHLFSETDFSLDNIWQMEKSHRLHSFALRQKISFQGKFEERNFISRNVIGSLPGTKVKPDDRYLILSAHYDHLGIGPPLDGDSIYNGTFDNAAGTAALLEFVRVFRKIDANFPTSIIFLFLTGEEKGALGSIYYVDHPAEPLHKTIADINVDGLAMFDVFQDVVGVGSEYSTLGEALKEVATQMGLSLSPIPPQFQQEESFARSDQISFAKAGIPAILIMDGLNYQHFSQHEALTKNINWFNTIYHTPFDDMNQPMNLNAAIQHLQVIFSFSYFLASHPEVPRWYPGVKYQYYRQKTISENR